MNFYLRLITSISFFMTIIPLIGVAIYGFGMMENEFSENPLTYLYVRIWTFAIIPVTIYIGVFTKFDNPFKKKEVNNAVA